MDYSGIIQKVAEDTGLSEHIIDKTYKSFWLFIRNSIQQLPLKDDLTEVEFLKLRPNFNIPSLGKLYVTYNRYKGVKEKFNYIKNIREKNDKSN